MKQGCPVQIPAMWVYDPVVAYPAHIRVLPQIDGPRTNEVLSPGDIFRVSKGVEGADGILYLKLADGRGWLFDRMPGVGAMCIEYRVAKISHSHYSCAIWYRGIELSWPEEQRRFCCQMAGRGCPASPIRSSTPLIIHSPMKQNVAAVNPELYDCSRGYLDAERSWSREKRAWCCLHRGTGCDTTTALMPSDIAGCEKGSGAWHQGCEQAQFESLRATRAQPRGGSGMAPQRLLIGAGCLCIIAGLVILARQYRDHMPHVQPERPKHMLLGPLD